METLKLIFWIVGCILAMGVIIAFLKGSRQPDPTELSSHTRYNVTAMLEKEIEDSNNNQIF